VINSDLNFGVLLIAIGFLNGMVRLVDSLSLEDCTEQPFNNTNREAITLIAFSQNCEYFATAVCYIFLMMFSSCTACIVKSDSSFPLFLYYWPFLDEHG